MTEQISALIIDTEQQSLELMISYLKESGLAQLSGSFSDIVKGYNAVLELRPSVVIIDISSKTEFAIDIVGKIDLNHKTCKISVPSDNYSADLVVKAMRARASEFLPKPIIKDDFFTAMRKIKD